MAFCSTAILCVFTGAAITMVVILARSSEPYRGFKSAGTAILTFTALILMIAVGGIWVGSVWFTGIPLQQYDFFSANTLTTGEIYQVVGRPVVFGKEELVFLQSRTGKPIAYRLDKPYGLPKSFQYRPSHNPPFVPYPKGQESIPPLHEE